MVIIISRGHSSSSYKSDASVFFLPFCAELLMRGKEEGLFPRPPPSFPFWVPPSVRHPNTIESPPIAYVCIPPPSSFRPNLRGESDLRTTVASAVEYTSRLQEEKRVYPPSHPSQKSQHLPMRSLEHYHQASALGRRRGGFVHAKLPSCSISVHVKHFSIFWNGISKKCGGYKWFLSAGDLFTAVFFYSDKRDLFTKCNNALFLFPPPDVSPLFISFPFSVPSCCHTCLFCVSLQPPPPSLCALAP